MKEGLICSQFWPGDQKRAMENALLIAENEPTKNKQVDFLFAARFDASHDRKVVDQVARKFDVRQMTTRSRVTGHPDGCWMLWFSIVEWVYSMRCANKLPAYKWIFPFEADTAPISKNWIAEISEDWDKHQKYVVGSETFHWCHHINGNLMLSGDLNFLKWLVMGVTSGGVRPGGAWDLDLFPKFARWGVGFSPRIKNVCGKPSLNQEEFDYFRNQGVSFLHGVKSNDLYNLSRKNLLDK